MQQLTTIITVLLITTSIASAEPASLTFTGGLGVESMGLTVCDGGDVPFYACPNATEHRLVGAAPLVSMAYIKKTTPKRGFALRFGPELTGSVVGGTNARGVMLGGMMTVGVHFHRVWVETGMGLSALSFRAEDVRGRTGTIYMHYGAGLELNREWSLTVRADAHVMMHSPMAAGLVAGGIAYTPR